MNGYLIPDVRLPFATASHPESQRVQELTENWCRTLGLLRSSTVAAKFRALGYGRIMATLCPNAPLSGLALITDWNSLFFIADDQQNVAITTHRTGWYEDLVASMRQVIARPGYPTTHDRHPLVVCLRDLLQRTLPGAPGYWTERFRHNLDRWLKGHLAENFYRVSGTVPTVGEYISVRRDAATVLPTLDLVEIVEGAAIPDVLYRSSQYQTLVHGTADIMCWINDIHSLHMERDDPINLVTVLVRHERRDVQNAIDMVAARIAERVEDYLTAVKDLPGIMNGLGLSVEQQKSIMQCVQDQQSWAAGMENWDRTDTIRFADSEALADGKIASYVEDLLDPSISQ